MGQLLDRRSRNLGHIIRRDPGFLTVTLTEATFPRSASNILLGGEKLWQLSY
jgi:hypothetical protein